MPIRNPESYITKLEYDGKTFTLKDKNSYSICKNKNGEFVSVKLQIDYDVYGTARESIVEVIQ